MHAHFDPSDLTAAFGGVLKELQECGFIPPMHFTMVSPNGSTMTGVLEPDCETNSLAAEFHSVHSPTGIFLVPVKLMFLDGNGKTASFQIELNPESKAVCFDCDSPEEVQ